MTEVRVTSDTGGQKGSKLARFDLVPQDALWALAEAYGRGAAKYDDDNWRRGYDWSLSFAAMQRHASQFWGGEDIDAETGSPHLAAVAWHAMSLLHFSLNAQYARFDNRQAKAHAGRTVPPAEVLPSLAPCEAEDGSPA